MNEIILAGEKRYLNTSAIKSHALHCSEKLRAGKFERVGQAFLVEVETDVENLVRQIETKYPERTHPSISTDVNLVTGELIHRLQKALNAAVARLIQRKVESHPGIGKTLQNTY